MPLDGSAAAKSALPMARLVAQILGATIHVVHATDEPLPEGELLARMNLSPEETRGLVLQHVTGRAPEALVQAIDQHDSRLVVMSTWGHTAHPKRLRRPTLERILRKARCPVLLVRPEIASRVAGLTQIRSVALPLNGTPSSAAVIGPAIDLAERSGAEVDVVYVAEAHMPRPQEPGTLTTPRYVDEEYYEWPAWAQEFADRFWPFLEEPRPTIPVRVFVRRGEPAAEILRFVGERESDLLVLEWRGRLDPPHAAVVRRVLVDAPCPVLVLRTTPEGEVPAFRGGRAPRPA